MFNMISISELESCIRVLQYYIHELQTDYTVATAVGNNEKINQIVKSLTLCKNDIDKVLDDLKKVVE